MEGAIMLGPWGDEASRNLNFQCADDEIIKTITIYHGNIIDGISFTLADKNGNETSTRHFAGHGGAVATLNLSVDPNNMEYVTQISGTHAQDSIVDNRRMLKSIRLHTNHNKIGYGPFGDARTDGEDGAKNVVSFLSPSLHYGSIVGFCGGSVKDGSSEYLVSLGLLVKPDTESCEKKLKAMEEELKKKDEEIRKLREELSSAQANIQSLQDELENKEKELQTMKVDYEKLKAENEKVKENCKKMKEDYEKQLKEKQEEINKLKKQVEQPKKVGPWGGPSGSNWDFKIPRDGKLQEITVHSGLCIDALTFNVKDQSGNPYSLKFGGPKGGADTFKLEDGEYLVGIEGYHGIYYNTDFLRGLKFKTNKRESRYYGVREGTAFSYKTNDPNGALVGFFGRTINYLTAIGVYEGRRA